MDSPRTLITQVVDSVKEDVLSVTESNKQKAQVKDMFEAAQNPFAGLETDAL